jgi:hypothetical protein
MVTTTFLNHTGVIWSITPPILISQLPATPLPGPDPPGFPIPDLPLILEARNSRVPVDTHSDIKLATFTARAILAIFEALVPMIETTYHPDQHLGDRESILFLASYL